MKTSKTYKINNRAKKRMVSKWDLKFLKLKKYLENNNQEYPSITDDNSLHLWIAAQRNKKKKGTLKNEELNKLNSINFVWNIVAWKWEKMYSQFQEYAKDNAFPPCKGIDEDELVKWSKYQIACISINKVISKDQKRRFLLIFNNFEGPASRKKWIKPYYELVKYRQENPTKWPQYDRENTRTSESSLHVFCQTIRSKYREGDLGNFWYNKMVEIDFNFEGKTDNWTQYWQEVKDKLKNRNSISVKELGENAYAWVHRHRKKYERETLSDYQRKKIEELKLERFFDTWENKFEKVKMWIVENNRFPTHEIQPEYWSWLYSQKSVYKRGNLTNEQIAALNSINFYLGDSKEKRKEQWLEMFENVKKFTLENGRWPKSRVTEIEKKMYTWCRAQRQAKAVTRTGGKRKPLQKWQEDKLESIGFRWSMLDVIDEQWEQNFIKFKQCVDSKGNLSLPSQINGRSSQLYHWFRSQRIAYRKNKISKKRIHRFQEIGIDLNKFRNNSGKDGFGKWANKLIEIAGFIKVNGHYPKTREDKIQDNYYHSLARSKKAYLNNKLTERQLDLLKELNIKLD